ncbi:MAG: metallophosphoesterase [Candidatus Thiodiazotropha sp. 6PLUC9]
MKSVLTIVFSVVLGSGIANAGSHENHDCKYQNNCSRANVSFGIITDIHHTNKINTSSRTYSAALDKMTRFVKVMNRKADFVIELGDYVDTLVDGKDPIQNLDEIETIYAGFKGPRYHVLGNHEFDNLYRNDFLEYIKNSGIPDGETYYSFNQNGVHFVVLDADYTVAEPHLPFDMQDPSAPFWSWKDAWVPQQELDWLTADLAANNLPTVVFAHQVLHRDTTEAHTIKNADVVRGIFEHDGQVVAVFSGHDHRGEVAVRNGIHYFVLEGNVGISLDWDQVSPTEGLDPKLDSPYTFVKITEKRGESFNGMRSYQVKLVGNAQQYSFTDQVQISKP